MRILFEMLGAVASVAAIFNYGWKLFYVRPRAERKASQNQANERKGN